MKGYEGKVTSGGVKDVKAPYPQKTNTKASTQKGKDLRSKGGSK